jgi:hypothetical protein
MNKLWMSKEDAEFEKKWREMMDKRFWDFVLYGTTPDPSELKGSIKQLIEDEDNLREQS